jgi:hypothetical protein
MYISFMMQSKSELIRKMHLRIGNKKVTGNNR